MHRRTDDSTIYKVVKFWPLILAIVGIVVTFTIVKQQTEDNTRQLKKHERRLTQVEINAAVARLNTDALVENLLDERQQRQVKGAVNIISTNVLKASEERTKEEQ